MVLVNADITEAIRQIENRLQAIESRLTVFDEFIPLNEVARILDMSRGTLYKLIRNGRLTPHYTPSVRSPRYSRAAVMALFEERKNRK